jgi:hypothetical protein
MHVVIAGCRLMRCSRGRASGGSLAVRSSARGVSTPARRDRQTRARRMYSWEDAERRNSLMLRFTPSVRAAPPSAPFPRPRRSSVRAVSPSAPLLRLRRTCGVGACAPCPVSVSPPGETLIRTSGQAALEALGVMGALSIFIYLSLSIYLYLSIFIYLSISASSDALRRGRPRWRRWA